MPTALQFRRGTTSQNNSFTGAVGEISVDTDKDTLRVHDGSTAGGFEVVTTAATQTLTNKTIVAGNNTISGLPVFNAAQEFTATQNFNATALTDASTIAWDASANQVTSVTLGGNRTLGAATNQIDGGVYVLSVIQDGTGSRTLSFNSNYKFAAAAAPTLTTTANARDVIVFLSNGTNMFEIGRTLNLT